MIKEDGKCLLLPDFNEAYNLNVNFLNHLSIQNAVTFEWRRTIRPFRRQITDLVLNVSFWPELEHKMAFVYARKDDVAVTSF